MKNVITQNSEFKVFVQEIKAKIQTAHIQALKVVNKELIALYTDIGKTITQRQESFGWGKSVVESLSKELQSEFEGLDGFSPRNLWNMRNFYLAYQNNGNLQAPVCQRFPWSHNVLNYSKNRKERFAKRIILHKIHASKRVELSRC